MTADPESIPILDSLSTLRLIPLLISIHSLFILYLFSILSLHQINPESVTFLFNTSTDNCSTIPASVKYVILLIIHITNSEHSQQSNSIFTHHHPLDLSKSPIFLSLFFSMFWQRDMGKKKRGTPLFLSSNSNHFNDSIRYVVRSCECRSSPSYL